MASRQKMAINKASRYGKDTKSRARRNRVRNYIKKENQNV
jgi:hypothetical protein